METAKKGKIDYKKISDVLSVAGILFTIIFMIWCYKMGFLTDREKMRAYFAEYPVWGDLLFIVFQAVQVVIPIIPGGVSTVAGVAIYGTVRGFIYNYIGICAGSIIVFLLAKKYGRDLMRRMFKQKLIDRYDKWTETNQRFKKMFAFAIFFPVAPDDYLCYLAGTTSMSLKTFVIIILLGKPASIFIYSMGVDMILQWLFGFIGNGGII